MKKGVKVSIFSVLLLLMLCCTMFFYNNKMLGYVIVFGVISFILFIGLLVGVFSPSNPVSVYKNKLNKILKTYESILVKSVSIPNLEDKNIIMVECFEDLVNAQVEIRKPIYYKMELSSCSFCLLDSTEACIYIMKVNDEVISDLELYLRDLEIKKRKKDPDYSLFDDVTRTLIVKLENSKAFKVSPIKKKNNTKTEMVEELI